MKRVTPLCIVRGCHLNARGRGIFCKNHEVYSSEFIRETPAFKAAMVEKENLRLTGNKRGISRVKVATTVQESSEIG